MTQSEFMSSWENLTADESGARGEWQYIINLIEELNLNNILINPVVLDIGGGKVNFRNI